MTTIDQNPTAGIGDPYWYEWTIGQNYVIDMLNPDNGIESVTLQSTEAQGLDDVVVVYKDGSSKYVQVKHTRKESTITFGNMLPLLKSMSKAWTDQKGKWTKCSPVLFSNRKISTSSIIMEREDEAKYVRPALDKFLTHLRSEVKAASTLDDVKMPTEWFIAWNEWCEQLNELSNEEKLTFLKLLEIKGNQSNLDDLTIKMTHKISKTFGISYEKATSVFSQLDHALREWGTTFRGEKESINCENVYEVLSLTSQELVGDHMLYPPEPFFPSRQKLLENLATELISGENPVVFLTGLPGQGKTSIVSALANRREPIIDLRYHAFKPITPHTNILPVDAGVTTKAEVLWGDLLTELRSFFFKGRLAKYNVPIRNDFLTLEQLISEVLRLADILGEERGRPTIIAIDGIDHAARANFDQYSFLDTLIPPNAVPTNVRFLIVGQPAEAYEKYPFWLRDNTNGVSKWVVDNIRKEDISRLLETVPSLSTDSFEATVRLVNSVSQGNTLAAIFAIEEAKMISNVEELQIRLQNRQLFNGLSAYYEKIWSAAVTRLEERYLFVGQRLAAVLSLTKEKITGEELAKIFSGVLDISSADWTESLRSLRPLLVEDKTGFHVIHNDIRVHLTKQIHAHPERLCEVASLIADYYWRDPVKQEARHTSLFELLKTSNRYADISRVFTPDYIMEGIAINRPIQELQDQCKEALLNVVATRDWNCVHIVSCAAATLMQLHKSVDWMGKKFEYLSELPPVLISEGRVPNIESWNLDIVYNAMLDAYSLIQVSEWERAYGLMRRWFGGITPIYLANFLKKYVYVDKDKNLNLDNTFEQILRLWGKVSYHIGLCWEHEEKEKYQTDDLIKQEVWVHFSDAMMEEALKFGGVRDWIECSQLAVYQSIKKVETNLMDLVDQRRWAEVAYTLKEISDNYNKLPETFLIKGAALSILTGRKELFKTWVQPIVDKGFKSLDNLDLSNDFKDQTLLYSMVSFVLGWTQPHRENSEIGGEGVKVYYQKREDSLQRGHLSALLRGSALAGKWLGVYKRRGKEAAQLIVTTNEVKQVLMALVGKKRNYHELALNHQKATRSIVEILIECSSVIGGEAEKTVYEFIKEYCESYPTNYLMEITWSYLWNRGEEELLEEWFNYWCGQEGAIWHFEISERTDIVERLSDLAEEIGLEKEAKKARQLLKWGMIGYTGHREYALDSPKKWYQEINKIDSGIWKKQGKLLLEISQEVSEIGDNSAAIFVEAVVSGSVAHEGATAMWSLLNSENMKKPLIDNINMIFDGLIIALETLDLTEIELLSIWSFGIGTLDVNSGYERCYLVDLKKALLLVAERNGITSLDEKLAYLGPAEYQVTADSGSFLIPSRWFEREYSISEKYSNEYFQSLEGLQIDSAISKLVELAESKNRKENLWFGICLVANRLKKEKPNGYPRYLNSLVELLLTHNHYPYSWSGSQVYLAFQEIIPLVRDNVRFDMLNKVIDNLDFEMDEKIWLGAAAENLDAFCRFRAVSTGLKDLSEGLQRHLVLHEKWILGNGFLPDMQRLEIPVYEPTDLIPRTWSEFATRYFFRILQSNNLTRIELALRGLWSMAQVNPTALIYIVEQWDILSLNVKERILLLAERAATSNPTVYEYFSDIVQECFHGVELSLKLHAWIILKAITRRTGVECPDFQFDQHPEYELYLSSQGGQGSILDIPSIERGLTYEIQSSGIVHSLINRLDVVTEDDIKDIESKFVAYSDIALKYDSHIEPVQIKNGQMKVNNLPHKNLLMKVIYHELFDGRWREAPIVAIAQALLKSDDPFILLQSPSLAKDAHEWPIDYEIERFNGNKKMLLDRILPNIHAGLSDDEVVLGAVFQTYSWSTDIEVVLTNSISAKGFELLQSKNISTMNGRTFALYYEEIYDPLEIDEPVLGMTYKAGGIGEFINQSMLCYPSLIWKHFFNWYPAKDNPLIWLEEGVPVVRFEHLLGCFRNTAQEHLHRQPFLQRWVCSKKVLERIKTKWEITITPITDVNVRKRR